MPFDIVSDYEKKLKIQLFVKADVREMAFLYYAFSCFDTAYRAYVKVRNEYQKEAAITNIIYSQLQELFDTETPGELELFIYQLSLFQYVIESYRKTMINGGVNLPINFQFENQIVPYLKKYHRAITYFDELSKDQQLLLIDQFNEKLF